MRVLGVLALVLLLSVGVSAQPDAITPEVYAVTQVTPLVETVGRYEKFELVVALDAVFNNPYDPTDIRLDAQFRMPSGDVIVVPGFYQQDYDLRGRAQTAIPAGGWSWRVRFTPTETGAWQYRVLATTLTSRQQSRWQPFTVTESDNRGFVRVDPRNPRYFAFDDGRPYFAIGENMGWSVNEPLADYERWLDALAGAGGNFIRVWMPSWGFGIEWLDTGLGQYDERQLRAYQLDRVFEMARERDVSIMLTLLNHGPFSLNVNSEWDANPFNVANGGMLEHPGEFATHPEAIRLWHQRLRYIAARWGYATNLMAWEWWNEVNWTPMVATELLVPWIERSAAVLDSYDPYDHLITHSGSPVGDAAVWSLGSMSFVQDHKYNMENLLRTFRLSIPDWLERYPDRPFLMGEFGSPSEFDTQGIMLHLGLWSPPMLGAAGTGMFWWWDTYVHPNDLYHHFAGISAFFASEDLGAHDWQPASATASTRDVQVYGQQTADRALLWAISRDYNEQSFLRLYQKNLRDRVANPLDVTFPDVAGAEITLEGLTPGSYTIEIWDTVAGSIITTEEQVVTGSTLTITLPTFNTDLALKVIAV